MTLYKPYRTKRKNNEGAFRRKAHPGRTCAYVPKTPAFLLLLVLFLSSACSLPIPYSQEAPVEPVVTSLENTGGDMLLRGRFSVVNPEMKIYALAVSSSGRDILFSSDARSVNMLDDQGRLKWEVVFEGLPVAAELASNGYYIAVGTDRGKVYFLHKDGRTIWEKSFTGAVEQIALAPGGNFLAVSIKDESGAYKLYGLDQWGTLFWERETGPLLKLNLLSEDNKLYYLENNQDGNTLVALKNGEILWEEKASMADVSGDGESAVIYNGNVLYFYSLEGETSPLLMWSCSLSTEISLLELTEKGEHILAYSAFPGVGSNLFAFHKEGFLLWEKKIPSGSLLQTSRFGERIVASSWQEYSEDFSRVLVLDKNGDTLQEIEMASRIEKISLSSDGNILALAGNEGNIFILDMPAAAFSQETEAAGDAAEHGKELYRPVAFTKSGEELYITLYFYDAYAMRLVPVSRSVKSTAQVLQAAVSELVKGPRRLSGLSRTIPKDASIKVTLQEGIALIDLPEELNRLGGSSQITGIIDSLVLTASQFPSVEGIRFLVEGKEARVFGAEGFIIDGVFPSRPLAKSKTMLYLPYRSGDRYFLLPREAVQLGSKFNTPDDLLKILLAESRRFLPAVPELNDIKVKQEEIILDWNSSFKKLFPPEGSPEEKALAALFLDSVLLTLGSNFQQSRFILYVEGEPWKPPFGYPSPVLEFRYPFYINPE
jgi:outer membrane protein assembly factor BamB